MKHTCLLFIGEQFSAVAKGVAKHVLKNGGQNVPDYLSVMTLTKGEDGYELNVLERAQAESTAFVSDLDAAYLVAPKRKTRLSSASLKEEAGSFLGDFFSEHVTLEHPGDGRVTLTFVISPSTQPWAGQLVEDFCKAIENGKLKYDVDVLVHANTGEVCYDSAPKSSPETIGKMRSHTVDCVSSLLEFRKQSPGTLRLVFLFQDKNQKGVSVTFTRQNVVRILGEFAIAMTESFNSIFPTSVLLSNGKDKICLFGISQLAFDSNYVVQYLLRKAFIYLLQREGVGEKEIDINKVAAVAKNCLERHKAPLAEFYRRHISQSLAEGKSEETAINACGGYMDEFAETLEKDFLGFMDDMSLSLPEKRCVLAILLGEDDPMLAGELFDNDQISFLDCYNETAEMFIGYNNSNVRPMKDANGMEIRDGDGRPLMVEGVITKSLDSSGRARFQLDELKRLSLQIRQSMSYVRNKEEELEKLLDSQKRVQQSDRVISADGFTFEGNTFKFIPDLPAEPVNDTYSPKVTAIDNIDLSGHFPPVRNQGNIGACSPHALVAIYEYILRKNHMVDCDLSERYVYYNTQKMEGSLDTGKGTTLYGTIHSLETDGVCIEELCPYDPEQIDILPSESAYEDGRQRRVTKSMNIPLGDDTQQNVDALRSALSEGYPVAFGLRLFDSFAANEGFVPMPTEEEIAGDERNLHAMVICGYDDKDKYFLVRNSWGTSFGKDGYCYIPYAYIGDKRLVNGAYIIAEVSQEEVMVEGVVDAEHFSFNAADNIIKAAVIGNMITEERNKLTRLKAEYKKLRFSIEELLQELAKTSIRTDILKETKRRMDEEIAREKMRQNELITSKAETLKNHERVTQNGLLMMGGAALVLNIVNIIWSYNFWREEPLNLGLHTVLLLAAMVVVLMACAGWWYARRTDYRHVSEDNDILIASQGSIIGKMESEMESIRRRFHVGGMMMDKLTTIDRNMNDFYHSAKSYVNNLALWLEQEKVQHKSMTPDMRPPFIPAIDTAVLDEFFNQKKEEILEGKHLYSLLQDGSYQLDRRQIVAFQKRLKQHILKCLYDYIGGFSMYDYVMGNTEYPYLPDNDSNGTMEWIRKIDEYSLPFAQLVNPVKPTACLLIKKDDAIGDDGPWMSVLSERPKVLITATPNNMTIFKTAFMKMEETSLLA